MFKDLLEQLGSGQDCTTARGGFFDQPWPFRTALATAQAKGAEHSEQLQAVIGGPAGLAHLPKALIPFHLEKEGDHYQERTAFEQQVREAVELSQLGRCQVARLHCTLSPEHQARVETLEQDLRLRLGEAVALEISYSSQHEATDTLCLTQDDRPARTATDQPSRPILRPGGHGALLRNLAETNADLVLIKNIDNVQPASGRRRTLHWKASLLGALALAQEELFELAETLQRSSGTSGSTIERSLALLRRFGRTPGQCDQASLLKEVQRPIRLCGVVPNKGEPGGGPFWVRDAAGTATLQIVEGAQIDPEDPEQQATLRSSTHFNPVDLACALRDRHGHPYNLEDFLDPDAYFVAHKSHQTQPIRALEHPGLWNGAMAHWLTLFVEAPLATFTPVKTVWDLLRPEHQR